MRSSTRKIVVNEIQWLYRVGKSCVTATCVDTRERRVIDFSSLTGMEWNSIERGKWKRYFHITPKQIAAWLSGELEARCQNVQV